MTNNSIGILLTNIGTPSAPTARAVRRYFKDFLSDPRVIEIPSVLWKPLLYGIILPFRSGQYAKLYKKIWTNQGSPLLVNSQRIALKLQNKIQLPVELGMHYSNPSIPNALKSLHNQGVDKVIVLPLYPQYSATTTASSFDIIANTFKQWRNLPEVSTIHDYATNPDYIKALTGAIDKTWRTQGKKFLLMSFHGLPKYYTDMGDPYQERCLRTARLIAEELRITRSDWAISYQSRLGKGEWLKPYTNVILKDLPRQGITDIQVICPGFAADCLETLDEIAERGKSEFFKAGGKFFHYIPALNDTDEHIAALINIIKGSFYHSSL